MTCMFHHDMIITRSLQESIKTGAGTNLLYSAVLDAAKLELVKGPSKVNATPVQYCRHGQGVTQLR